MAGSQVLDELVAAGPAPTLPPGSEVLVAAGGPTLPVPQDPTQVFLTSDPAALGVSPDVTLADASAVAQVPVLPPPVAPPPVPVPPAAPLPLPPNLFPGLIPKTDTQPRERCGTGAAAGAGALVASTAPTNVALGGFKEDFYLDARADENLPAGAVLQEAKMSSFVTGCFTARANPVSRVFFRGVNEVESTGGIIGGNSTVVGYTHHAADEDAHGFISFIPEQVKRQDRFYVHCIWCEATNLPEGWEAVRHVGYLEIRANPTPVSEELHERRTTDPEFAPYVHTVNAVWSPDHVGLKITGAITGIEHEVVTTALVTRRNSDGSPDAFPADVYEQRISAEKSWLPGLSPVAGAGEETFTYGTSSPQLTASVDAVTGVPAANVAAPGVTEVTLAPGPEGAYTAASKALHAEPDLKPQGAQAPADAFAGAGEHAVSDQVVFPWVSPGGQLLTPAPSDGQLPLTIDEGLNIPTVGLEDLDLDSGLALQDLVTDATEFGLVEEPALGDLSSFGDG